MRHKLTDLQSQLTDSTQQVTSHKSKLGAARTRVAELQAELQSQQQQHSVTTAFHLLTHAQTFWLKIDVTAHR